MNTREGWPHQGSCLKPGGRAVLGSCSTLRSGRQLGHSEAWGLPEILLDTHPRGLTPGRGTQLSAEGHANRPTDNHGGNRLGHHKGKKLDRKGRAAVPDEAEQRNLVRC